MAKKIIKVEDTKTSNKSSLDLGKITKTLMENGEAIGKIAEWVTDIINSQNQKTTSKKTTKKTVSAKKSVTKKASSNKDSFSTVIDIAETILKNK